MADAKKAARRGGPLPSIVSVLPALLPTAPGGLSVPARIAEPAAAAVAATVVIVVIAAARARAAATAAIVVVVPALARRT
jgi:hypothetical protein